MGAPGLALESTKRRLARPALLLIIAAGCSSALDNQPAPPDAGPEKPVDTRLKLPNQDLTDKRAAAQASSEKFEPVFAYAKGVVDYCTAALAEKDAATKGKPKAMAEPDPNTWLLIEDARGSVDKLMESKGLASAQIQQLVVAKGHLLFLAGRGADEEAMVAEYALGHPDALVVVKRRLELLREASDAKDAEVQCAHSRVKLKSAPDAVRLDLLTACVALHPDNAEGKSDPPDYTQFLPSPSKAEQRLYRKHLIARCIENVGDRQARCKDACGCSAKGFAKDKRAECKKNCVNCRVETAQKIRDCKKIGTPAAAKPAKRGSGGKGAADGPEPQTTVL
jgi:hypothetical protein